MPGWLKLAVCVGALVWVAGAPAARADDWRPVQQSCISPDGSGGQCGVARSGNFLTNVLIAPGGTTAYVTSSTIFFGSQNALLIYDRDPATGRLTQRAGKPGCISQDGTGGQCDTSPLIGGAGSMALSPDGKQLYVLGGGGIVVFDVLAGGALQQKPGQTGCVSNDGSDFMTPNVCTDARGMQGPFYSLALSPDGKTLYVAGSQIAAFDRNAATGVLTQLPGTTGCLAPGAVDGCHDVVGVGSSRQISVAPDLRTLYVAGDGGSLVSFSRDVATGALTLLGCITTSGNGGACATDARLAGASGALTSADNRQVYVTTQDGVLTYARAGDGTLAFQGCINDRGTAGCRAGLQMIGLSYIALSPDGQALVAATSSGGTFTTTFPGGFVVLDRDAATGALTERASPDVCVTNDGSAMDDGQHTAGRCIAAPLAGGAGHITFAGDSQLYVGAGLSSGLIAYKRDFYPTCASSTAAVPHDAATPLQLACGDRNGDPLALQVSAAPISGTLGGIDQGAQRVTYVPFSGYAGADSFRYRAVAGGLSSQDATFNLGVAAAAAPAGGGGGGSAPIDADHDGFFSGQDCNDHDPAIHPGAREIRGNHVDENCDGLAEPFPTLSTGVSTRWDVKRADFTLTQLMVSTPPRGAKLEIRCAGKGCPFAHRALSGKARRGFLDALHSLRGKVHFRAKQTIEVRISAPGFNTKVAQLKLRAGHIPTTTPLCLPPGGTRPQRTCT